MQYMLSLKYKKLKVGELKPKLSTTSILAKARTKLQLSKLCLRFFIQYIFMHESSYTMVKNDNEITLTERI